MVDEAEPDGLLAIGGDLSPERLIQAYAHGIFPWFEENGEVYWFSPDPRLVMLPGQFRVPDSLRRIIKSGKFEIRFDTAFGEVIRACAGAPRPEQEGTWISESFISAYTLLHQQGFAHSVESYSEGKLVGGLYGISLGAAFFGESMFFTRPNASKAAYYALVEHCKKVGYHFIDCQIETTHLQNLGAVSIPRVEYIRLLDIALKHPTRTAPWH